jgi:iron complex transport system permease protein
VSRPIGLLLLGAVALVIVLGAPLIGPVALPLSVVGDPQGSDAAARIFWQIRMPRVAAAFLGGAGLAIGGAVFQAVFRNPLATPYILGVAAGASFGVAAAARIGLGVTLLGLGLQSWSALGGALLAVAVVWLISRARPGAPTTTLLLAGVSLNFFFSSLILFLQYTASFADAYRILRWLMGGLGGVDLSSVLQMAPFVIVGALVIQAFGRELDLLATGSELAASRGVSVARARTVLFVTTSLMVGGVVAACGPIGFVGMMAPHICRLLLGPGHRLLLPASAVFGGAFLVLCDTAARVVLAPAELPVGVITAFLGAPFFLWLLLRKQP